MFCAQDAGEARLAVQKAKLTLQQIKNSQTFIRHALPMLLGMLERKEGFSIKGETHGNLSSQQTQAVQNRIDELKHIQELLETHAISMQEVIVKNSD